MTDLLRGGYTVVNAGVSRFAQDLSRSGASVIDMHWRPPGAGTPYLGRMLADLANDTQGLGHVIRSANDLALRRLLDSRPVLKDIRPAREVLSTMTETTILHAGPPIGWERMAGAVRGAVVGGLIYEGLASNPTDAAELAASGAITFAPCHSRDAVGPMAGIVTPRMPMMIVEDESSGARAFASMNEGWGRALRFGAYDDAVIKRLRWMEKTLAPSLAAAINHLGGIDIRGVIGRALHMGDECHNRDIAASTLFFKTIAPPLAVVLDDPRTLSDVLAFMAGQEHFFLNVGMAACKAGTVAASNIPHSTMVTAMARNGTDVGILVGGMGDRWFTAPARVAQGLYFPGYSEADAGPDLGDSAVTETAGIGAFAMAAAPAIVGFVGGTAADAYRYSREMYEITLGENPNYTLPPLDFRGTPTGVDVRAVVETGIAPVVNTGIAHKEPGRGLVGAGIVKIPLEAFEAALRAMHGEWVEAAVAGQ